MEEKANELDFYYKYEFRWGLVHMYSNILLFPGLFSWIIFLTTTDRKIFSKYYNEFKFFTKIEAYCLHYEWILLSEPSLRIHSFNAEIDPILLKALNLMMEHSKEN